jgi:hypothetical protein
MERRPALAEAERGSAEPAAVATLREEEAIDPARDTL